MIDSAWGDYDPKNEVEAEWDTELAKRAAEVRSGAAEMILWETVKTGLAKEFGWDK